MECTLTKIWPIFGQLEGQKSQKNGKWDSPTYFHHPPHSNDKVVFDHGPNSFYLC